MIEEDILRWLRLLNVEGRNCPFEQHIEKVEVST